jgi:hypothetical protein
MVQINLVEVVRLYFASRKNNLYDEKLRGYEGKSISVGLGTSLPPAHEGGKIVSPTYWPPLSRGKYLWCSFLLDAESSPGP